MRPTPFAAVLAHTAAAAEYVAPVLLMQLGEGADGILQFSGRSGPSIFHDDWAQVIQCLAMKVLRG